MKLKKISRTIIESYFKPDFCCEEFEKAYLDGIFRIYPDVDFKMTIYSDKNNNKNIEDIGLFLTQDDKYSKVNFCPFCGEKISEVENDK